MEPKMYHQNRHRLYSKVEQFWPDLYGEEYALYDLFRTNQPIVAKIHEATNRIGRIFFKTAKLLRVADDDVLLEMGFPRETLAFIRLATPNTVPETVIARLDLVQSGDSFKCLEINADTPTFIKEVFSVNEMICNEFAMKNPNEGMEARLASAIQSSIKASLGGKQPAHLVFTAHDDHVEDLNTARYLQELCGLPARFVPLNRLQIIKGDGLYDERGTKIDLLYRQTFPIENLIQDRDDNGNPIGLWLLELVTEGKLKLINPPSAFLLQNKAVQAVIWGLHQEGNDFYTATEHQWIAEYFLPTYLEPDFFLKSGQAFVKKPSFGREGDTVEIYDGSGHLLMADTQTTYTDYTSIFQQYLELPSVKFASEKGQQTGRWIIGSFLVNGHHGGIGLRVGNPITDNLSYFLPIGIQ